MKSITKNCFICKKEFSIPFWFIKQNRGKYCSNICKLSIKSENHPNWKGDKVGYQALHSWIRKNYISPTNCEFCGKPNTKGKLDWANRSGKYLRDRNDWLKLCRNCHRFHDGVRKKPYHWIDRKRNNEGKFL